jgi:hypothetical protein
MPQALGHFGKWFAAVDVSQLKQLTLVDFGYNKNRKPIAEIASGLVS